MRSFLLFQCGKRKLATIFGALLGHSALVARISSMYVVAREREGL